MAIKQTTIKVSDGTEYLITQVGAIKGIRILKELSGLFGPALAAWQSPSPDLIHNIVLALTNSIYEAPKLDGIINELMVGVAKANGSAIDFNMEFAGRYKILLEVLKAALEHNYGDLAELYYQMVSYHVADVPVEEAEEAPVVEPATSL